MRGRAFSGRLTPLAAGAAWALAAIGGCYAGSGADGGALPGRTAPTTEPTPPASSASSRASALPCAVEELLQAQCVTCHGDPPRSGAPNRLVTYDDLVARSLADPSKTMAQMCLARMKDGASPMPPGGLSAGTDLSAFAAWVEAGTPRTECLASHDTRPTTPSPYDTRSVCTSRQTWTRGHEGDERMHPGRACNGCHGHAREDDDDDEHDEHDEHDRTPKPDDDGPIFGAAGTVYPSAHEPDECLGAPAGSAVVVVTDASGRSLTLPINASGNFATRSALAKPLRAKVVANGRTREMAAAIDDGDCNGCHTERGQSGAPGRIMLP